MGRTIGNPLTWAAKVAGGTATHMGESIENIGGTENIALTPRTLTNKDITTALRLGVNDFVAARADVMFLVVIYPIIGLVLAAVGMHLALLPLLFPLVTGFALLGPLAAVGLYEISRCRAAGKAVNWASAFGVLRAPNFASILVLGLFHIVIFIAWMLVAMAIYSATLGPEMPSSLGRFVSDVFNTVAGWEMIVFGTLVGLGFALLVLSTSVISFPLLLDRKIGVPTAIVTSAKVTAKNPRVVGTWGLIVAVSLFIGAIPALIGLVVVLPILGHATWHLYRRALEA